MRVLHATSPSPHKWEREEWKMAEIMSARRRLSAARPLCCAPPGSVISGALFSDHCLRGAVGVPLRRCLRSSPVLRGRRHGCGHARLPPRAARGRARTCSDEATRRWSWRGGGGCLAAARAAPRQAAAPGQPAAPRGLQRRTAPRPAPPSPSELPLHPGCPPPSPRGLAALPSPRRCPRGWAWC